MAGKKGGASMAAPKERVDQELENTPTTSKGFNVKIDKLFDDETKSIRAAASLNIGGFAVHGIRVFEKDDQLWVSMPQNSYKNANGEVKYDDVFHPVTAEARSRSLSSSDEGGEESSAPRITVSIYKPVPPTKRGSLPLCSISRSTRIASAR
jgi:DNA-binding cell septation regulator SpoVG